MRRLAVTLLVSLCALFLHAQEDTKIQKIKIGVIGTYGTYSQSDIKDINQIMIDGFPFESKVVDDFEPGYIVGAYLQYCIAGRFSVGPSYHYRYTGSRLGRCDYSGTFSFDQYLHAHSAGVKSDLVFADFGKMNLTAQLDGGITLTSWEMETKLEVSGLSEQEKEELNGVSWYVSPAVSVNYMFLENCILFVSAGYSFDIVQKYHYKEDKSLDINKNPNWSGLLLSIGLEFQW